MHTQGHTVLAHLLENSTNLPRVDLPKTAVKSYGKECNFVLKRY